MYFEFKKNRLQDNLRQNDIISHLEEKNNPGWEELKIQQDMQYNDQESGLLQVGLLDITIQSQLVTNDYQTQTQTQTILTNKHHFDLQFSTILNEISPDNYRIIDVQNCQSQQDEQQQIQVMRNHKRQSRPYLKSFKNDFINSIDDNPSPAKRYKQICARRNNVKYQNKQTVLKRLQSSSHLHFTNISIINKKCNRLPHHATEKDQILLIIQQIKLVDAFYKLFSRQLRQEDLNSEFTQVAFKKQQINRSTNNYESSIKQGQSDKADSDIKQHKKTIQIRNSLNNLKSRIQKQQQDNSKLKCKPISSEQSSNQTQSESESQTSSSQQSLEEQKPRYNLRNTQLLKQLKGKKQEITNILQSIIPRQKRKKQQQNQFKGIQQMKVNSICKQKKVKSVIKSNYNLRSLETIQQVKFDKQKNENLIFTSKDTWLEIKKGLINKKHKYKKTKIIPNRLLEILLKKQQGKVKKP